MLPTPTNQPQPENSTRNRPTNQNGNESHIQASKTFALPEHLAAKANPELIGQDEQHLATVVETLQHQVAEVLDRLDQLRASPGGIGRAAMDRDLEIHRLTFQLGVLRRYNRDLCLGRMVGADRAEPVYVGRIGLSDREGHRLLIDWRAPAAEPFFAATHAHSDGLISRRRYRWSNGQITDYWDEVFTPDGLEGSAALDDQSAFIASLGSSRSPQMRDVLGTIQADQDAIIRAGSHGALVVEGGPGTGKTVVALHRAAYLLYSDPRLREGRGGVLFVGPHRPYLAYIADVLPSLGEEGVQTCTVADMVIEGATATVETDPEVARLKASTGLVSAIEPAVRLYEEPPTQGLRVETAYANVWISAADWAEAFASADPGTPHNEAREQIRESLVDIAMDKLDDQLDEEEVSPDVVRRALLRDSELTAALNDAWTLIEPTDLVGDLWWVPAYLRRCAPGLTAEEVHSLQRQDVQAWTISDLPLLDAARHRLGDPEAARRQRRHEAALAVERANMDRVVEDLLAVARDNVDDSIQLLRRQSIRDDLVDESVLSPPDRDRLAGPFAHIVVDEAQELTDAEWLMLLRRCPSRSLTIVGDRAQARHGFTETWQDRLDRIGVQQVELARLTINYRTPEQVMAEAEPVIRAAFPDANVPTSIRTGGAPVIHGSTADLDLILQRWLTANPEGVACVIGDPTISATDRVRSLTPQTAKGLEFDVVVLIDPEAFGSGIEGTVDRYVAMTRATQQLVILTSPEPHQPLGGEVHSPRCIES